MKKLASLLSLAFLVIVGCGEDEKNFTRVDEKVGFEVAAHMDGLTKCDSQHVAALTFVKDSSKVFFCDGDHWISVDGKDGKKGVDGKAGSTCSATKEGSVHTIVCGHDTARVDTRVKTPSSCKTTENEDGTTTLTCGDKSATTIIGKDGGDGEPCTFIDNGDFTMTMACGDVNVLLYGDICGDSLFDPEVYFCNGVTLYKKCGGLVYDPRYQDCSDSGTVLEFCGTQKTPYDPAKQFCYQQKSVRDLCGGEEYHSSKVFCYNDKLFPTCGGTRYDGDVYHCEVNSLVMGSVMDKDSNVYRTLVLGGEMEWMIENYRLNVEGSLCPSEIAAERPLGDDKFYGEPKNAQAAYDQAISMDCSKNGRVYNWAMIMNLDEKYNYELAGDLVKENHQGICPDGWHVPTVEELQFISTYMTYLRSEWLTELNRNPTGGFDYVDGALKKYYKGTYIISSTENTEKPTYGRWMSIEDGKVSTSEGKADFDALRCVKNKAVAEEEDQ